MAHFQHEIVLPMKAASAIPQYAPLAITPGVANSVQVPSSTLEAIIGFSLATVASPGLDVAVVVAGWAKAIAAASLGAGAHVGMGSINGALAPLAASGVASVIGPIQAPRWRAGLSLDNAAAGQVFSVLLLPGELF